MQVDKDNINIDVSICIFRPYQAICKTLIEFLLSIFCVASKEIKRFTTSAGNALETWGVHQCILLHNLL